MIKLNDSKVVYDDAEHTYMYNGQRFDGITGMIKRQLFADEYKNVPDYIMKRAQTRGKEIHKNCEWADNFYRLSVETGLTNDNDITAEAQLYTSLRDSLGYYPLANEYTVTDYLHFASNIDCVWEKDGKISLADIKTTYKLNEEYLAWQLSIYAYLFELVNTTLKVDKLFGVWLRDKIQIIEVKRKSKKEIQKLFECELNGTQYSIQEDSNVVPIFPKTAVSAIIEYKTMYDFAKQQYEMLKEGLEKAMSENNVNVWDAGMLRATIVKPSCRKTFDLTAFKKDNEELYNKYMKETETKQSIKITIREEKTDEC